MLSSRRLLLPRRSDQAGRRWLEAPTKAGSGFSAVEMLPSLNTTPSSQWASMRPLSNCSV
jgi:hypothetical protein